MHATDNALKVSRGKGCESALEIRLRISWPLSERSEPFMPRFRVLGFVAKSGHVKRAVVKTSEPLQNALGMRFVVKVVLEGGTPQEPRINALVVRVWGAFGGVLRHPPKGGPRTENHF